MNNRNKNNNNSYWIVGKHAVESALKNSKRMKYHLCITKENFASFDLSNLEIKTDIMSRSEISTIADNPNTHQGTALLVKPLETNNLNSYLESNKENKKTFIILDQISDVRNFGAIIRTAECTGVDAIIIQKKGGAPVTGDTVKTSAGAIFKIPICKVDHIKDAIFYLKASNITTVSATEKTENIVYDLDLNKPLAIIMGSEGKGVSKSVLNIVDHRASLPLLGDVNSLNVSVACGAFLYEAIRQRSL